jgi:hypothetical protein
MSTGAAKPESDGNNYRRSEWLDDGSTQLQTCDGAAGKFVYALNVTECRKRALIVLSF